MPYYNIRDQYGFNMASIFDMASIWLLPELYLNNRGVSRLISLDGRVEF